VLSLKKRQLIKAERAIGPNRDFALKDPWFPILLMFTVLLASWLGVLGPLPSGVARWIKDWQPSIAAVIAISAAALAYRGATRQLAQNERLERKRRSRKHASVRAMLPLALSRVSEYAEKSVIALNNLIPLCQGESLPHNSPMNDLPQPLPQETLEVFAEFIEYSDDIDASLVETMVAWIQIHNSRVRGLIRNNQDPAGEVMVLRTNIEGSIIDAASIYAAAAALFEYGRRRGRQPPTNVTWDDVRRAFRNMRMWDEDHPRLYAILEGRETSTSGPFDRLAM
jgi:hypothetical protein